MQLLKLDQFLNNQGTETSVYSRMRECNMVEKLQYFKLNPNQEILYAASDLLEMFEFYDNEFGDQDYIVEGTERDHFEGIFDI